MPNRWRGRILASGDTRRRFRRNPSGRCPEDRLGCDSLSSDRSQRRESAIENRSAVMLGCPDLERLVAGGDRHQMTGGSHQIGLVLDQGRRIENRLAAGRIGPPLGKVG